MNLPAARSLAIVIPWFGRDQCGGSELQAWQIATRLSQLGYVVEVLSTCCASYHADWSTNHHAPGVTQEPEGFSIRRFPVEPRDRAAFDRVCGHLLSLPPEALKPGVSPLSDDDERIFAEHLIRCPSLLEYLQSDGWRYDAFIFIPYLYGPILNGLPVVASRAFLQPCLHDEAYAYLNCVQKIVHEARGLLWNSEGEFELGCRLFGPCVLTKSSVGVEGLEPVPAVDPQFDVSSLEPLKPFALLLGRKDAGKGTLLATQAFARFRAHTSSRLNLVVAGPGALAVAQPERGIFDLGLVSSEARSWLLHHTAVLLQPSANESFSRVMFEAWQCGRPVVALKSCLATACAVETSRGGWTAQTEDDWVAMLQRLDGMPPAERDEAGARGRAYAKAIADWDEVMQRYQAVLGPVDRRHATSARVRCVFFSDTVQTVTIVADDLPIRECPLQPGQPFDTGWMSHSGRDRRIRLQFQTDHPATFHPPDPRPLGFRLIELQAEDLNGRSLAVRFTRGWNRSETGPGENGQRWSTGPARAVIDLDVLAADRQAIHQVLPNLGYGDAIGNCTLWLRDRLQAMGFVSEIYARHIAPEMLSQSYHLSSEELLPAEAALIYHHSIGTEITPWVCRHEGPKVLLYHNITPARFFEPYRPEFAEILQRGREQLLELAPHFPFSTGVSRFNAAELAENGFENPEVLPLCIDPAHWSFPPDPRVMTELQDGRTNVLFVGRITPNKRQEDVIYTFKFWLEADPTARLFLVGTAEVSSFYLDCLVELARKLRIDHAVKFVGRVNDAQLHAYYRCASMFWCFSEHEGFCVPLIEACAFGIPVVARAEGAIKETLGDAGLLLDRRYPPDELARLIARKLSALNRKKLRQRVHNYDAVSVTSQLYALIDRLLDVPAATSV